MNEHEAMQEDAIQYLTFELAGQMLIIYAPQRIDFDRPTILDECFVKAMVKP